MQAGAKRPRRQCNAPAETPDEVSAAPAKQSCHGVCVNTSQRNGANHTELRPKGIELMLQNLMQRATADGTKRKTIFKSMADDLQLACPNHVVRQATHFFQNMFQRVVTTGDWVDRPRVGRAPKVSTKQALCCNTYFMKGIHSKGRDWIGYTSIEHAAMACPQIKEVLEQTGASTKALWRAMIAAHPNHKFNQITITIKPALKKDVKEERLMKATQWSTWPEDKFKRCLHRREDQVRQPPQRAQVLR
jgi:hypothetical protein